MVTASEGVASVHRTYRGVRPPIRVLVERCVSLYTVLALLPALPYLMDQLPGTSWWWTLAFDGGMGVSAVAMFVLSLLKVPIRWPGLAFAASVLGAVVTVPFAFSPSTVQSEPWVWWGVGPAVVLVGLGLGGRPAVLYGIVLGTIFGALRTSVVFGRTDIRTAVAEAVFAPATSLSVLALALGLLRAAGAADQLAERVYRRQLNDAVDREVGEARAELDRLIHDDVMTTLTSLTYTCDAVTAAATAKLAREALDHIADLEAGDARTGELSVGVFVRIAGDTAEKVSPKVQFVDETSPSSRPCLIPLAVVERILSAMREAVRNAARHAGADRIRVTCQTGPGTAVQGNRSGEALLVVVADNGRGFRQDTVTAERLGIAMSMRQVMEAAGGEVDIESAPGSGTVVRLRHPQALEAAHSYPLRPDATHPVSDGLPVAFPVLQLVQICWGIVVVGVAVGLLSLERVSPPWPALVAMPLLGLLTYVTLHRGRLLTLPRAEAVTVVALAAAVAGLVCFGLPLDRWPGAAVFWYVFPLQLLIAGMVFRRRPWHALASLLLMGVFVGWWTSQSINGAPDFVNVMFGPTIFYLIAVAVARILDRIGADSARLRLQESAAIEKTARRYAGSVQRTLWLTDLVADTRGILQEITEVTAPVHAELVDRAVLLEAKLRETVLARHVLTDELADLTDTARRKGISVTFVDSRHSPLPQAVSRAVLAETRRILKSETVSRLVVRFGPADRSQSASVLSEDRGTTHITNIGPQGRRSDDVSRKVPRHSSELNTDE